MKLNLINGPNLDMLGVREEGIYGQLTLAEIEADAKRSAAVLGIELDAFQSNSEGEIVDHIHSLGNKSAGIIINAGAYTHTSIAIRDALLSVSIPFIEVHLSNVFAREEFRHTSYLSDIAQGVIVGFGADSYLLAIAQFGRMLHR